MLYLNITAGDWDDWKNGARNDSLTFFQVLQYLQVSLSDFSWSDYAITKFHWSQKNKDHLETKKSNIFNISRSSKVGNRIRNLILLFQVIFCCIAHFLVVDVL